MLLNVNGEIPINVTNTVNDELLLKKLYVDLILNRVCIISQ